MVSVWFATVGFGSTLTVTVNGLPSQPKAEIGTTVYNTLTDPVVVLVHASFAKVLAETPLSTIGSPAAAVKPPVLIAVMLYVLALGPSVSLLSVIPSAISLHAPAVWLATTGSGFTVTVYVKLLPVQPFAPIGVTV